MGRCAMFQTRLLHAFRTDHSPGNRLAVVVGASAGAGLEHAICLADEGFDLLVVDTTQAIFRAGAKLVREANRVTAQNFEPASIEDVEHLLDAVGDRTVDVLAIYGDSDASGARHLIETMSETMRLHGRGRILIDGRESLVVG